jgi:DNA-binding HxlR family transcriptional regulator
MATLLEPDRAPGTGRGGGERHVDRYFAPGACAVLRDTFDRIGDKWTLLAVAQLADGPRRFGQLLRQVEGVSQRMLTLTLRRLERDGLVSRTVYPEIPPRVEYELTELGLTLVDAVAGLADWALDHHAAIDSSRAVFDASAGSNVPADAATSH